MRLDGTGIPLMGAPVIESDEMGAPLKACEQLLVGSDEMWNPSDGMRWNGCTSDWMVVL